jgi:hypothetical protein
MSKLLVCAWFDRRLALRRNPWSIIRGRISGPNRAILLSLDSPGGLIPLPLQALHFFLALFEGFHAACFLDDPKNGRPA